MSIGEFEDLVAKFLKFVTFLGREEHQGRLAYYIPISDTKWSSMFDVMETGKSALAIESYSLSQTSLEQVFLTFTKYQREDARRLASA